MKLLIEYQQFHAVTILKPMPHPCAVHPLLICSRPHVLWKYLGDHFVCVKRRLCPHCVLPSVSSTKPSDLSGCVYYSSSKESNGSFVCETDCGNTWSPNVIRPQEFHQFDVTKAHFCAHKVSVICCFSCEVGTRSSGPRGALTPQMWS